MRHNLTKLVMEYFLHILILIGIYVILSVSLNLIVGYTGLLSVAHAAFYGVGAYVAALLAIKFHSPFLVNIILAIVFGGLLGAMVGIPTLRTRDDYFMVTTFVFQVIIFSIFNNWVSFTGGPMGLPGIPAPSFFGWRIESHLDYLIVVLVFSLLVVILSLQIGHSPFGRVLKAIREDEIFSQAHGKNIAFFKIAIFVIGAGMASVAGLVYAYYISFIEPTSFTVMESIFIISIVIIGGAGNIWGSIVGATFLVALPEALRFIGMPNAIAANIQQLIYGALLVLCMLYRPQGFLGEYSFDK